HYWPRDLCEVGLLDEWRLDQKYSSCRSRHCCHHARERTTRCEVRPTLRARRSHDSSLAFIFASARFLNGPAYRVCARTLLSPLWGWGRLALAPRACESVTKPVPSAKADSILPTLFSRHLRAGLSRCRRYAAGA